MLIFSVTSREGNQFVGIDMIQTVIYKTWKKYAYESKNDNGRYCQ